MRVSLSLSLSLSLVMFPWISHCFHTVFLVVLFITWTDQKICKVSRPSRPFTQGTRYRAHPLARKVWSFHRWPFPQRLRGGPRGSRDACPQKCGKWCSKIPGSQEQAQGKHHWLRGFNWKILVRWVRWDYYSQWRKTNQMMKNARNCKFGCWNRGQSIQSIYVIFYIIVDLFWGYRKPM